MDVGGGGENINGTFTVTMSGKERVAAALPLQEHWLPLSNLDLLLPPVDVSVYFCYKKPTKTLTFSSAADMVAVLKKAMAQVLVSYYAFAGEVVPNSVGEPELLCNNRGVDFFEAFADIELKHLNFYNPDDTIEGKLVPKRKDGVLAIQATELKCGGLVVACTFDHRIADAYSSNMFLVSWAEMAQSKAISVMPSFRRSMLNPRHPGYFDPSIDCMYMTISKLLPPCKDETSNKVNIADDDDHLISRIYYVKADDLKQLQLLANANNNSNKLKRTKLESFSAFLWKTIAEYCSNEEKISMGIVVDGRARLLLDDAAYFGNVLSIPYGAKRVDQLIESPLSCIADEVHDFLKEAVSKDHFLNLIDWVEAHRPEPAMPSIYATGSNDGPAFVVSSGQRFPVSKVNFGWGVPLFGSYHNPWGSSVGYVMPMPSPISNGDWVVYMRLLRGQLEFIETDQLAANIFKPLTFNYLNNYPVNSP